MSLWVPQMLAQGYFGSVSSNPEMRDIETAFVDGEKWYAAFCAPRAGIIDAVAFHVGGTNTLTDLVVSLNDLASNLPGDVLNDGGGNASHTVLSSESYAASDIAVVVLDNDYNVATRGQQLCVYLQCGTNTSFQLRGCRQFCIAAPGILPFQRKYVSGAWGATPVLDPMVVNVRYTDDPKWVPIAGVPGLLKSISQTQFYTSIAVDKIALEFSLPFACTLDAATIFAQLSCDVAIVLSDASYNQIWSQTTYEAKRFAVTSGAPSCTVAFATQTQLSAGTTYHLELVNATTTACDATKLVFPSAEMHASMPYGADWKWVQHATGGAWGAADNTARPAIALDVTPVTVAAGTNIIASRGLRGGFQ